MRCFHSRAASRLSTSFVVISAFVFAPATVLADSNLVSMLESRDLTKFAELVKAHKDIFTFNPNDAVTIIAPNDEAFERAQHEWERFDEDLIRATLRYHILKREIKSDTLTAGDTITVATSLTDPAFSNVTGGQQVLLTKQPNDDMVLTSGFATRGTIPDEQEDIPFDWGTIHIVDSVMMVPRPLANTARDSYRDLISFLGALYEYDLYQEFNELRDLTIFIPRNAAFQQLAGRFANEDRAAFRRILRYHFVPGILAHAWDFENNVTFGTASRRDNLTITRDGNSIYVNSAQVLTTDMLIANGVVQIIDNVLNPDNQTARPIFGPKVRSQAPVFTPTGATSTGAKAPTPWLEALPCTADCPEPEITDEPTPTSWTPRVKSTQNVAQPHQTGLMGVGLGMAALGALAVL